jgi:hypothetical protein
MPTITSPRNPLGREGVRDSRESADRIPGLDLVRPRRTSLPTVTFEEMEAALRQRLEALPPAARAELIHVFRLPDFDRADAIGTFWGYPESRAFAELLIDCEENRTLRAVLVGMLRERDR